MDFLSTAVAKRSGLITPDTNAARLIDAAGDGLPGLVLESYAGHWLVSTTGNSLAPQVLEWISKQDVSCYWKRRQSLENFCQQYLPLYRVHQYLQE